MTLGLILGAGFLAATGVDVTVFGSAERLAGLGRRTGAP